MTIEIRMRIYRFKHYVADVINFLSGMPVCLSDFYQSFENTATVSRQNRLQISMMVSNEAWPTYDSPKLSLMTHHSSLPSLSPSLSPSTDLCCCFSESVNLREKKPSMSTKDYATPLISTWLEASFQLMSSTTDSLSRLV
jgi:hypothetical protein